MKLFNEVFSNEHLSAKAKGIYGYLATRPTLKGMTLTKLYQHMNNGYSSLRSGLKELRDYGYLSRQKKANGRIAWHLKKDGAVHSSKLSPYQRKAYDIFGKTLHRPLTSHENKKLIEAITNYSLMNVFYAFEITFIMNDLSAEGESSQVHTKIGYVLGILKNNSNVKGDFVYWERKAKNDLPDYKIHKIHIDLDYMKQVDLSIHDDSPLDNLGSDDDLPY